MINPDKTLVRLAQDGTHEMKFFYAQDVVGVVVYQNNGKWNFDIKLNGGHSIQWVDHTPNEADVTMNLLFHGHLSQFEDDEEEAEETQDSGGN